MSRPDAPPLLPVGSAAQNPADRPRGVLVVDDEEGVRRVLSTWLWHRGFAVWLAADCSEAVEAYRSHRASIGVALLDVQMPGRDGPRTLADLRELDPDIRACFMTGDAGRYTEQNLLDLGALAVFRKPFCLSELAAQLAALTVPIDHADGVQETRWCDDDGQGTRIAP